MRSCSLFALSMLSALLLSACSRATVWQVHNATDGPVTVNILNEGTQIQSGDSGQVVPEGASFDIVSGANDWFYVMPEIPDDFVVSPFAPWKNRQAAMGLTREGKLMMLAPGTKVLPDRAPKQPKGFPLSPYQNGGGNKMVPEDLLNAQIAKPGGSIRR